MNGRGPDRQPPSSGSRPAALVAVRVTGARGLGDSLESVLRQSPRTVPVIVCAPEGTAEQARRCVAELNALTESREAPVELRVGPEAELPQLLAALGPIDFALVDTPCRVGAGWLDGLRDAAYSGSAVAGAVAVSQPGVEPGPAGGGDAGCGSGPAGGGDPGPGAEPGSGVLPAGATIAPARTDGADGPCRYIRRSAIELAALPPEGPPPFGAELARRCLRAGLCLVLAGDVIVDPGTSESGPRLEDGQDAARQAEVTARRAREGLSVIIDARNLDGPPDGTRRHVLELVGALAASGRARIHALVPARVDPDAAAALERIPSLRLVTDAPGGTATGLRADVAHRPFQVAAHADLIRLGGLAERLIVTHQDLISYHSPDHFDTSDDWAGYRAMTRSALRAADGVVFFSAYVRDGALAADLVEAHRTDVVPLGIDHVVSNDRLVGPALPPEGAEPLLAGGEVILCLGADFWHKNRLFALRLVQTLQREHAWTGRLVLAGPSVLRGGSGATERALLHEDPRLADAVLDVGPVTENEKRWLFERSGLVLYPTVEEGFGLVPFEAAAHDRPCLWSSGSALAEFLPAEVAGIVAWDVARTAVATLGLLRDERLRAANVTAVTDAGRKLRWARTAERMITCYERVRDAPPAPVGRLERERGLMQAGLSEDAMRLVGPGGALPRELERPLLALSTHPRVGRPVLGAIRAAYEAAHRWSADRRG